MKIAITGGSGFVGKTILRDFGDKFEFILIGTKPEINFFCLDGKKYEYRNTDYSVNSLEKALKGINSLIHLAAKRPAPMTTQDNYSEFHCNVEIASNLFEVCRKEKISNVVFTSSISVYGEQNTLPYTETQKPMSNDFYGLSKIIAENIAELYNRNFSMAIKSLRVAIVIGAEKNDKFMFNTFINKAIKKECLTIFGNGKSRKEYIYVRDLAEAIIICLQKPKISGIFNVGASKNISHKELAEIINEKSGNKNNIKFLYEMEDSKLVSLMSSQKIKDVFGWEHKWKLSEAIEDIINFINQKNQ